MVATLAPTHTPVTPATTDRERALNSVFATALEGGIGYWSTCSRYYWSIGDGRTEAADFIAVVHDIEDESEPRVAHVIDASVIARGIRKAYARKGWNEYQGRALRDLNFGKWDDADYDSITADLIVQFGLFGEEVYG